MSFDDNPDMGADTSVLTRNEASESNQSAQSTPNTNDQPALGEDGQPITETGRSASAEQNAEKPPATTQPSDISSPEKQVPQSPQSGEIKEPKLVDETINLNLSIMDFAGKPISGLKYQIVVDKVIYNGATDAKGNAAEITGLKPNLPLEFFVQKDDGTLASKYKGYTGCNDMSMCAVSPHVKIPVETEPHKGTPATPPTKATAAKIEAPVKAIAPVAPGAGQIKGDGKHTATKPTACRDETGNPNSTLKEKSADWAKRHHIPTFGLWSWDDFKPGVKGCTNPALKPPPANDGGTAKANESAKASAPAKASSPVKAKSLVNASTPAKVTSLDQKPPEAVVNLVKIMEEQVVWQWKAMYDKKINSATIQAGILSNTFEPEVGKVISKSEGRCYPSVKLGLWRAGLVSGFNSDIPAKGATKWLEQQGYKNLVGSVPDARWALPGDVIVYRYSDEVEAANTKKAATALKRYEKDKAEYDKQKAELPKKLSLWQEETQRKTEAKEHKVKYKESADHKKPKLGAEPHLPDDGNYGHIDVRTYDAYMSDFKQKTLPNSAKYVVIGIYRKVYDPLPDLRLRAFLKVLREWECHEESDDSKRYYMLGMNLKINGSKVFSNTNKHPFEDTEIQKNNPAGAYQMLLSTYKLYAVPRFGIGQGFSPLAQDRLAVAIIENQENSLALIRKGKIGEAISILKDTWSSLPGGLHPRKQPRGSIYTLDDVLARYSIYLNEQIEK